jgi:2-dehydro-3-deoxyphosphooctonate aldolase (KDO 8-P synthase)
MKPLILIAGPCQIESLAHARECCHAVSEIAIKLGFDFYYKSSFDKANRTSVSSQRGAGLEDGVNILGKIKTEFGVKTLTDVHETQQCNPVAEVCDVLQIPAFLCRQTDLLQAAAATGRTVNVKKGQFLSPTEVEFIFNKIPGVESWITERGTSFGYNRLIVDYTGLEIMKTFGHPVIFDATHSVQMPGAVNGKSGGNRQFVRPLALAAAAVGVDGFFIETHPDPDNAPSDGPNMIAISDLEKLLTEIKLVWELSNSLST